MDAKGACRVRVVRATVRILTFSRVCAFLALVPVGVPRAQGAQQQPGGDVVVAWDSVQPATAAGAADSPQGLSVRIRFRELTQAADRRATLDLPLTETLAVRVAISSIDRDRVQTHMAGALVDGREGEASLTIVGDTLSGRVVVDGRVFLVRRGRASTTHVVTEVDQSALPPERPPRIPPVARALAAPAPSTAMDTNAFVDLMVLYTPAARAAIGGPAQMNGDLIGAVNNANLALANANVTHRFRLVHYGEIPYSETGDLGTSLDHLTYAGDGQLETVAALRDQFRADVVTLITNESNACGIGWLMSQNGVNASFAPYAYNVVYWDCANANLTLAHEIGHNMGLQHDRANAGGSSPSFPYAFGYAVPGVARDVMAYACPATGPACGRRAIFSTPLANFPGTGTLAGTATEDGALALNGTSGVVANFRQSVCTYSVSPTAATFGPAGGAGTVSVVTQAGCAWSAVSNQPSVVAVTSGWSGSASGTVGYTVSVNVGSQRSGALAIAGQLVTITQAAAARPPVTPTRTDFDGDLRADVAVFRPSTGAWYILSSALGGGIQHTWGGGADIPVPGDYDGDGRTDIAVFRPSNGQWHILRSATGSGATYTWGGSIDVPVPGDYDGDGRTDIAVFRPSTGSWYILRSSAGSVQYTWGGSLDTPVPADYDGDGRTDIGVFRSSTGTWYLLRSTSGSIQYTWGGSIDRPVPGDYDGDGRADIAVFRASTGAWYVLRSRTGTGASFTWGGSIDTPVPADYDGDLLTDIAVFRSSTGAWYILSSATGTGVTQAWGGSIDIGLPRLPSSGP